MDRGQLVVSKGNFCVKGTSFAGHSVLQTHSFLLELYCKDTDVHFFLTLHSTTDLPSVQRAATLPGARTADRHTRRWLWKKLIHWAYGECIEEMAMQGHLLAVPSLPCGPPDR